MIDPDKIRDDMMYSVCQYVMYGWPLGGFLNAIFNNNLTEAALRADRDNIECLPSYELMLQCVPIGCYGSDEIIKQWSTDRRDNPFNPSNVRWPSDKWTQIARLVEENMDTLNISIED